MAQIPDGVERERIHEHYTSDRLADYWSESWGVSEHPYDILRKQMACLARQDCLGLIQFIMNEMEDSTGTYEYLIRESTLRNEFDNEWQEPMHALQNASMAVGLHRGTETHDFDDWRWYALTGHGVEMLDAVFDAFVPETTEAEP